jgi:Tol biopolymer transport system component/predicted Ser/Thr protein kinase
MALTIGDRLGPYEILGSLGKGGMGEVYRARDTRIGREVAVKTSAERFSERFEREARVIASLNHPNICTLFDVGPNYLVMELIEGPTLAERIKEGAVPLEEALKIASQIAEALGAAHDKNVVHRDLKPGNVKIRPDGTVKVLDFGLAKMGGAPAASSEDSPTLSMHDTQAGVVLGTAAYMSPEQAKGKPADARADVWAFGVVLYEMLTGNRLHQGDTLLETIASVLKASPDLVRVPPQVRRLLRSCLQKDPKDRLHHIGDWKLLLDESTEQVPPQAKARAMPWLWPSIAGLALAGVIALGVIVLREPASEAQEIRTQIPKPENLTFNPGTQAAISPDGRWISFAALGPDNVSRYYLRALDSLETRPLPGSEGIIGYAPPPFWSYDSRYVVYGAEGKLRKSEITGTPAQTIAETGLPFVQGGTWSRDGVILYARNSGHLMQVSETGGTPVRVTVLAPGEVAHRWPQFLPDGRRFLYQRVSSSAEKTGLYVGSLDVKPEEQNLQPLLPTNRQAWWVTSEASGKSYLLTQRDTTLLVQAFDPDTLKLGGAPVPIANDVGSFGVASAGLWGVARNGTLVYRSGGTITFQLVWRDLTGNQVDVQGERGTYFNVALSPDGTKAAFRRTDTQGNMDIWVRDLVRGNDIRLTFSAARDDFPVWSPDSEKIAFASNRNGTLDIYEKPVDNSAEERLVWQSDRDKVPTSWSPNGRFLVVDSLDPQSRNDIWVVPLDAGAKPCVFLKTEFLETDGQFSPDGGWIAYRADPSAISQVYVRQFSTDSPCSGADRASPHMMSTTSGIYPRWRNDGKQLFYISLNGDLMAVDVQTGATLQQTGAPRRLFGGVLTERYTPNRAGDRFLFLREPDNAGPPPPFTMVQNWLSEIER